MATDGDEDLRSQIVVLERCMHAWERESKSLEGEIKSLDGQIKSLGGHIKSLEGQNKAWKIPSFGVRHFFLAQSTNSSNGVYEDNSVRRVRATSSRKGGGHRLCDEHLHTYVCLLQILPGLQIPALTNETRMLPIFKLSTDSLTQFSIVETY
ncbi:unnamed protein product [Sphagnum compactum]